MDLTDGEWIGGAGGAVGGGGGGSCIWSIG